MTDNRKNKFEIMLPADSVEFVKLIYKNREVTAINPCLSHNRFYIKRTEIKRGNKEVIKKGSLLFERLEKGPVKDEDFCGKDLKKISEQINERNKMLAASFSKQKAYIFKPGGNLICGDGGNSPYKNIQLLKLHHIYGIPYIPASTLKGALRNCWILEMFHGKEQLAMECPVFRSLFGSGKGEDEAEEGVLIFFDTFPKRFTIALDVETPHYSAYYRDGSAPLDSGNPIPIFLTCLRESEFEVRIACKKESIWNECEEEVSRMMVILFRDYGIGAKTALGYGTEW